MSIYHDVEVSWLSYRAASEAFENGHLTKAGRLLREALEESKEQGLLDPLLLHTATNLAERHLREGEYSNAASMFRVIFELRQRVQGDEHPEVVSSRKKLANALWQTGGLTPKVWLANQ